MAAGRSTGVGGGSEIMRTIAGLVAASFVAFVVSTSGSRAYEAYRAYAERVVAKPPAGVSFRPDIEAALNSLASSNRKREGRKPLKGSTLLRTAARAHALDILKTGDVGHLSARGDRFAVRFEAFGGDEDERGVRGENALRGRQAGDTAAAQASHLMKVWLGSSGHRRNLMAYDYRYVSTGVVQNGSTFYAVQIFWQR
jgi:uncharacterized protein YkwD